MNSNKYTSSLGYSTRLRTQTPYNQATSSEILKDLELLNWQTSERTSLNSSFPPKVLKKRTRRIPKFEFLDEESALESLLILMNSKKSAIKKLSVKRIVRKSVSFEIPQENIDPIRKVRIIADIKDTQKQINQ